MTKDELKAKIAEITKENTTEALHAEVLNALVDMIPGGAGNTITITETLHTDDYYDVSDDIPDDYVPSVNDVLVYEGAKYYFGGSYIDSYGRIIARFGVSHDQVEDYASCIYLRTTNGYYEAHLEDV